MTLNGIYRLAMGGKIYKSSYDTETMMLGPYHLPNTFYFGGDPAENFEWASLYAMMQRDKDCLGVFDDMGKGFFVVYPTYMHLVYKEENRTVGSVEFTYTYPDIRLSHYIHIGYEKTYQECKAIYKYPDYLLYDTKKGVIVGYDKPLEAAPLVNPPLSIYKDLIDTDYDAVYLDRDNQYHYLRKE